MAGSVGASPGVKSGAGKVGPATRHSQLTDKLHHVSSARPLCSDKGQSCPQQAADWTFHSTARLDGL